MSLWIHSINLFLFTDLELHGNHTLTGVRGLFTTVPFSLITLIVIIWKMRVLIVSVLQQKYEPIKFLSWALLQHAIVLLSHSTTAFSVSDGFSSSAT